LAGGDLGFAVRRIATVRRAATVDAAAVVLRFCIRPRDLRLPPLPRLELREPERDADASQHQTGQEDQDATGYRVQLRRAVSRKTARHALAHLSADASRRGRGRMRSVAMTWKFLGVGQRKLVSGRRGWAFWMLSAVRSLSKIRTVHSAEGRISLAKSYPPLVAPTAVNRTVPRSAKGAASSGHVAGARRRTPAHATVGNALRRLTQALLAPAPPSRRPDALALDDYSAWMRLGSNGVTG
jgi:hypothetical protein